MAVSQINISDSDISGGSHHAPSHATTTTTQESKPANKNFESKKSVGMDDLMSSLTNNKQQPAGKY